MVADEVAKAEAGQSVRSHARQAVARSLDKVNHRVYALSSASSAKRWVATGVTAAIAQAMATVTVKGALEIEGSDNLKTVFIRTSSTGCRPSAPHPNKRSSKKKIR